MGYLVNQTRAATLRIGGNDYTSSLVEWVVSDQSAYKNGCLQTSGTLTLGSRPGGPSIEDYDRSLFRRGTIVTLDVAEPGGAPYRHPRGYLYVISTSYDVESEELTVELGCRLVLIALTEEIDSLVALVPISLDIAQTTYSNCSAAFASAGQYVFQDNTGALVTGTFFEGDSYSGVAAGNWLSVLGVTTTSVQPLSGSDAIPDQIALSYQVPADGLNEDEQGRVDTETTTSYYFTQYPAVRFTRKGFTRAATGEITYKSPVWNSVDNYAVTPSSSGSSSCGNAPDSPEYGYWSLVCLSNWETVQTNLYVPATRTQTSVTEYAGPGSQVSRTFETVYGPAIEANGQYYSDKYAYCRSINAVLCLPDGDCPLEGMEQVQLAYSQTLNYYGEANELVRTVTDNYATKLSAAQPNDWRSGVNNGVPQDFNQNMSLAMFRESRTDTTYYQEGSVNVQKTVTHTSTARARSTGLNGNLDALSGIRTVTVRRSSSTSSVDLAPDRLNTATTSTETEETSIRLFSGRYQGSPSEAGPYILKEQIPVPLLFESESEIASAVGVYSNYLERFVKGDSFGLQIGEALRGDVVSGWRPGMTFRYYDPSKDRLLAMRMDATAWGVSVDESGFVTNGVWIGESNGSVVIPNNLRGNSTPNLDGPATPAPPTNLPSVDDETSVDSGSFAWDVNVFFSTGAQMRAFGNDGIVPVLPEIFTSEVQSMLGIYVSGTIVGPGGLLETENNGSVPLSELGNLVTVDAVIIDEDIFS